MIYLDNAATSYYKPEAVAQLWQMRSGPWGTAPEAPILLPFRVRGSVFETRELLSELFTEIGLEQVAFTANSTESLNIAIKGVIGPGDRVVTTVLEHNSVLRPLYELERAGTELVIVGCRRRQAALTMMH